MIADLPAPISYDINYAIHVHETFAAFALFVAAFQFVLRWKWSNKLNKEDGEQEVMRVWATTGIITNVLVAIVSIQFRELPITIWTWIYTPTISVCYLVASLSTLRWIHRRTLRERRERENSYENTGLDKRASS